MTDSAIISGLPQAAQLLRRDLRAMAPTLALSEIRFLVDYYYQQQENRKSAMNQVRAAKEAGESTAFTEWLGSLEMGIETQIKSALDLWTDANPATRWAKSQRGIGPVLAAGLAAHIDITRSTSVGKLWRFAGQDPTVEWHGTKNARELVKNAFEGHGTPTQALLFLSKTTHRRPTDLLAISLGKKDADELSSIGISRIRARDAVQGVSGAHRQEVDDLFEKREHVDNAISFSVDQLGLDEQDVYEEFYAGVEDQIADGPLITQLSRRPWNARLKVLCWKAGESFVYQSGHLDCFYGQLYRQYKLDEISRNREGRFAKQAQEILRKRRIGEETEARAKYEEGQLPDAHIHARAKRRAVKMFLSHYFNVAYEIHHQRPAPRPWIIEHGGHTDYLPPPNWPMNE